jgi:hypothetical protein
MMSGTAVDAGAPATAVPATVKVMPEKKDDDDVSADHSEYQYAISAHAHTLARPPHSLARWTKQQATHPITTSWSAQLSYAHTQTRARYMHV